MLEILPLGASKGVGVELLLSHLGVQKEEVRARLTDTCPETVQPACVVSYHRPLNDAKAWEDSEADLKIL